MNSTSIGKKPGKLFKTNPEIIYLKYLNLRLRTTDSDKRTYALNSSGAITVFKNKSRNNTFY